MQFPGTRTTRNVGVWRRHKPIAALLWTLIPALLAGCSAVVAHKLREPTDRDASVSDADASHPSDAQFDAQDGATDHDGQGEPSIVSILNEKGDDVYPAGKVVSGELLTIHVNDFGDQVTLSGLGDLDETLPVDTTDSTVMFRVPTREAAGPFQLRIERSDGHFATADLTLVRYVLLNMNRNTIAMTWDGETLDATNAVTVGSACTSKAEELRLSPGGAWAYRRCQGDTVTAIYLPTLSATTDVSTSAKKLAQMGWYRPSGTENPLTSPWVDRFVLSVTKNVTKYRQAVCTASWNAEIKTSTLNCQQTWTGLDNLGVPLYAAVPTDATMVGIIDNGNATSATIYDGTTPHDVTNSNQQTFLFTPGGPPLCHASGATCYLIDKIAPSIVAVNMTSGIILGDSESLTGCPPAALLRRPDGQGLVALVRMGDQAPNGAVNLVALDLSHPDQAPTVYTQALGINNIATGATWIWIKGTDHWYAMAWTKNTSGTHYTWFQRTNDNGTWAGTSAQLSQVPDFLSVAGAPEGSGVLFGIVKTVPSTTDLDQCTFEESPSIRLACHAIGGLTGLKNALLIQP